MLKDLIGQSANVGKLQGCTLREEADATGTEADVPRDTEAAAQTVGLAAGFASESDGVGLGDADDVVAIIVGCRRILGGGVDGVTEDLNNLAVAGAQAGAVTEARALAIDAQGGGESQESAKGSEAHGQRGCCELHVERDGGDYGLVGKEDWILVFSSDWSGLDLVCLKMGRRLS